jgi:hypothetical protein
MARILYSCGGEGQGHSSRVLTISLDYQGVIPFARQPFYFVTGPETF